MRDLSSPFCSLCVYSSAVGARFEEIQEKALPGDSGRAFSLPFSSPGFISRWRL
jgi:hypothetical protein